MNNPAQLSQPHGSEIAVIGMAGRFPNARNVEQFWHNLSSGEESIMRFSDDELLAAGVKPELLNDTQYVKASPVLEDVEYFDAAFFGMNPREASLSDPQQRLFVECAWEALENAGYDAERYSGVIGVYAGSGISRYLLENLASHRAQLEEMAGLQSALGNEKDFLATRVSYKLNLRGPSVSVNTACSTSLVAVHLACQSLLNGECDMALAGGVSVRVPVKAGYRYQAGGILSTDGHCRAFDARASGTIFGSGVGVVVLKPMAEALHDGDMIHAVIKGTAINNDGARKVGFTAPSVQGQADVIAEALVMAQVDPETISYIEAHGTGTELGDQIEVAALTEVFGRRHESGLRCALGSVKTNVGHLDSAAGVTGLIKTILALKHRLIPPTLHFERPAPQIDFVNSPFYVNTKLSKWETNGYSRRAGVSSFGIGGTNAHVVLEEAPEITDTIASRPWQLILQSAKTSSALNAGSLNLMDYLRQHPEINIADVAYTLQLGRRTFSYRRMLVCRDLEDAVATLETANPHQVVTAFSESSERSPVFMFPGGGSQHIGMGRDLYETESFFRGQVDLCSDLLKTHHGYDPREFLYPDLMRVQRVGEQLTQTSVALPALFVIEYALARLWMFWGIQPQAMIGHSLGEYVAACLAGVFSLEDALALVILRGRLFERLPCGGMLSVPLPEEEVKFLMGGRLSLAAVNGPSQCVVSGPTAAIEEMARRLAEKEIEFQKLHIDVAAHSDLVTPILEPFGQFISRLSLQPPQIPYISNVSGTWITNREATDPMYWVTHLRQTVRFSGGIHELLKDPQRILVEVGPGQTLSSLAKLQVGAERAPSVISSMRRPQDRQSDVAVLLRALGKLWLTGAQVDWNGFYAYERRRRIPLPTYPFERERYWIEPGENAEPSRPSLDWLCKKEDVAEWFYLPVWKQAPYPGLAQTKSSAGQMGCWLVFIDHCGIGSEIVFRLRQSGQIVMTVSAGAQLMASDNHSYIINPTRPYDYDELLIDLRTQNLVPQKLLHFWSVTPATDLSVGIESFESAQETGFYSLLYLAKALGNQQITTPIQWVVISNNTQSVTGEEILSPEKATVSGLCKVIPQEYSHIICRSIDIALPERASAQWLRLIDLLFADFTTESTDTMVAYRGNYRWVQTFDSIRLDKPEGQALRLREMGVYLITGGLGNVGFILAESLARAVRAKIILIGRSTLPDRGRWDDWLVTHGGQDRIAQAIRKIRRLEELGAEVIFASADVSDETQMRQAVNKACREFGPIHGVIHAAGDKVVNAIEEIQRADCERQFKAKVEGLFVLEKVLEGAELDFFMVVSSLSSVLGVIGLAAYPSAHLFMDAFVYKHNQTHSDQWLSVNWDNWQSGQEAEISAKEAKLFMRPDEAEQALHRILSLRPVSQIVVSVTDIHARIHKWIKREFFSEQGDRLAVGAISSYPRPILRSAYVLPGNEVEKTLADIWQRVLGIIQVGVEDNYFDLGGDSILAIQIVAKAKQAGLRLTAKQLFYHQTIAELAAVAGVGLTTVIGQGVVTGPVSLTPIQRWFFNQNASDPYHWNLAVMLTLHARLSLASLEEVVRALMERHDALRFRYESKGTGWQQRSEGLNNSSAPLCAIDLTLLPDSMQSAAMEMITADLQKSLNLQEGPLVRVAYYKLGGAGQDRLLFIIHHLVVDAVSWRILLEDLQTLCQQIARHESIQLPPKTTSFQYWAQCLNEYAQTESLQGELDYWLSLAWDQVSSLPLDHQRGANTVASARTLSVQLSVEHTRILLHSLPQALDAQLNDALLTALGESLWRWTGSPSVLIDIEGHGREDVIEGIDLSRTVGWFTTIVPVILSRGSSADLVGRLKTIKGELRRIPRSGIGYGVLRFLRRDSPDVRKLRDLPSASVSFLYLGQSDQVLAESAPFALAPESVGATRSPSGLRPYLIEVTSVIVRGRLQVNWTYSEHFHCAATIETLSHLFQETIQSFITHCRSIQQTGYTPSDFPGAKLNQKELDKIMGRIEQDKKG